MSEMVGNEKDASVGLLPSPHRPQIVPDLTKGFSFSWQHTDERHPSYVGLVGGLHVVDESERRIDLKVLPGQKTNTFAVEVSLKGMPPKLGIVLLGEGVEYASVHVPKPKRRRGVFDKNDRINYSHDTDFPSLWQDRKTGAVVDVLTMEQLNSICGVTFYNDSPDQIAS